MCASTKVNWNIDVIQVRKNAEKIADIAKNKIKNETTSFRYLSEDKEKLIIKNSISQLPLHKTLILIEIVNKYADEYLSFYKTALAKHIVFSFSNLKFGPEVGVGRKKKLDADVVDIWLKAVHSMCDDIVIHDNNKDISSHVFLADSRNDLYLIDDNSIDAVITSPPYPNEKDYSRTTRLESVLLNFVETKEELRILKKGLLRSNTRGIYKGDDDLNWIEDNVSVTHLADLIENKRIELGKTSGFEKLYHKVVRLYFGGMAKHLHDLKPKLKDGAKLAYVVGDQASYFRIPIRTGHLLSEIAEQLGYKVIGIDLFRTRISTVTKDMLNEEVLLLEFNHEKNRYESIIEGIFLDKYVDGNDIVEFNRTDIISKSAELDINLPKNIGDVIYSFKYRASLPVSITQKAQNGKEWVIKNIGRSLYCFQQVNYSRILPDMMLSTIKIPDSTPTIVAEHAFNDEQALLTRVRYNRLIDIFTGAVCYSLQNHLRTTVPSVGQIETDEIYVGVDRLGRQFIFPVQAKGGKDELGIVQIEQDFLLCRHKYPNLICRPIATQFISNDKIAIFEFVLENNEVKKLQEKHYLLVGKGQISVDELSNYNF